MSPAGSCQFSSISYKLFGQLCTNDYRPDLLLRRIALLAIECNPALYQSFLLAANAKTRRQQALGGAGVNLKRYIKRMKDPRCDGDAVTLQAIADALKVKICVIKFLPRNNNVFVNRVEPREIRFGDPPPIESKIIPQGPHHGVWISLRGEAHYRSLHLSDEKVTDTPRSTRHFSNIEVAMKKLRSILNTFEKLREEIEAQNRFEAHEIVCAMCFEPVISSTNKNKKRTSQEEDYDPKGKVNSCNHVFHIGCIMNWTKTSNACPVCRKRFTSIEKVGEDEKKCKTVTRSVVSNNRSSRRSRNRDSSSSSFCILCGQSNHPENLMLCDGYCGTACHAFCLGLDGVPEGNWFCEKCSKRRRSRRQTALSSRRRSRSPTKKRFNVTAKVVQKYCRGLEIDTVVTTKSSSSSEGKEEKTSGRSRNETSSTSSEESCSPRSAKRRRNMTKRANDLLKNMRKAASSDEKAYDMKLRPVQKCKMMQSVHLHLSESRWMSSILLDQGLLRVLERWMRPYKGDKVLMSDEMREHLLQLVLEMPVKFKHIQSSNSFGKLLTRFVSSDRDLIHQIVIKWSHLTVHKSEVDKIMSGDDIVGTCGDGDNKYD